jgi:hypothetical protein
MISFEVTQEESDMIQAIVERANVKDKLSLHMTLAACHANGNPLDFKRILAADNFNFWHDVGGIVKHLNQETGKLEGCFCPRMSL